MFGAGQVVSQRYVLEHKVGSGGMGEVWAARLRDTGERVALKLAGQHLQLTDARRERLLREARAIRQVEHPCVVELLDAFVTDSGQPVMVMEFLDGITLKRLLQDAPRRSVASMAKIMLDVVAAVGAAHEKGVVHRDLKPANIFLSGDVAAPQVKVLDFGIAKVADALGQDLTQTGQLLGTPAYMAPEQCRASATVDHRVDLWAIGIMIYELLSGERPVEGSNIGEVVEFVLTEGVAPLRAFVPDAPFDLAVIARQMLERDPRHRPVDLRAVASVLARHAGASVPSFGAAAGVPNGAEENLGLPNPERESPPAGLDDEAVFVGRVSELARLDHALTLRRAVWLCGPRGVGKTALVRHWLSTLPPTTWVLSTHRTKEPAMKQASLHHAMSDLGQHLKGSSLTDAAAMLPRNPRALLRLFPSLGELAVFARAPDLGEPPEPKRQLAEATIALRELLTRVADRHPLVLFVDDVDALDPDEQALLANVLNAPHPPRLMLVATSRDDDQTRAGRVLLALDQMDDDYERLTVAPLPQALSGTNLPAARAADPRPRELDDASHRGRAGRPNDPHRAVATTVRAAKRAEAELAFRQAAGCWRAAAEACVDLEPFAEYRERESRALVAAGETAAAGRVLVELGERLDDKARAYEGGVLLLRGGAIEEGLEAIARRLRDLGVEIPGHYEAMALSWSEGGRILSRGFASVMRDENSLPPGELALVELLSELAVSLGTNDLRAFMFAAYALRAALDLGEPKRLQRAAAVFVVTHAQSHASHPIVTEALDLSSRLAPMLDSEAEQWDVLAQSCLLAFQCRFLQARQNVRSLQLAEEEQSPALIRFCRTATVAIAGAELESLLEVTQSIAAWRDDAARRGDELLLRALDLPSCTVHLAVGNVREAKRCVQRARAASMATMGAAFHPSLEIVDFAIRLYEEAVEPNTIEALDDAIARSAAAFSPWALGFHYRFAACALLVWYRERPSPELLQRAEEHIDRLSEQGPFGEGFVDVLRAQVRYRAQRWDEGDVLLDRGLSQLASRGARTLQCHARLVRDFRYVGSNATRMHASRELRAAGIADPVRHLRLLFGPPPEMGPAHRGQTTKAQSIR